MDDSDIPFLSINKYHDHLLMVCIKLIDGTLDAKTWMVQYDLCFKICTAEKEAVVYGANKKLFETLSTMDIDQATYLVCGENMARIAAYLHHFWIPNQRNTSQTVPHYPLFELSKRIWNESHPDDLVEMHDE